MLPSSSAFRKPAAARSSASSQLATLSSPPSRTSGCVSRVYGVFMLITVDGRSAGRYGGREPAGRAPAQDVVVGERPLLPAGVHLLRLEIRPPRDERLEERGILPRR